MYLFSGHIDTPSLEAVLHSGLAFWLIIFSEIEKIISGFCQLPRSWQKRIMWKNLAGPPREIFLQYDQHDKDFDLGQIFIMGINKALAKSEIGLSHGH